jgi:hypothetical protein
LQNSGTIGTLDIVKRFVYIVLIVLVVVGGYYVWTHRVELGLSRPRISDASTASSGDQPGPSAQPAHINWQKVDRSGDGFKVEMPEDPKPLTVSATNEGGVSEPVNMIFSSPDGGTTYAVAWADNPPVMRAANRNPDLTLDLARNGALDRTQTHGVTESRSTPQGFPARDLVARNAGGGVLDSRLIYDGQRLYMLIACYPSMDARREQDVTRFFNSFVMTEPGKIPETLPLAMTEPVPVGRPGF